MFLVFYWVTSWRKIHNLVKFRTRNLYHLDIGTLFSLKNTQGSKLMTVLLTVINTLSHFLYITIGRLIKSLSKKMFCQITILIIVKLLITLFVFFNCYLAAPRPTSGHYRGDSLTHPMLITAFLHIRPEGHREPCSKVDP